MDKYPSQPDTILKRTVLWLVFYSGNPLGGWVCYDHTRVYRTFQGAKGECTRLDKSFEGQFEFKPIPFPIFIPKHVSENFAHRQLKVALADKDGAL